MYVFITFNNVLPFTFWVMSRVGKGLFIPSHTLTLTRICMTFKTLYPSFVPLGGSVNYALVR